MDTYEVKNTFERFAEMNDIPEEEEKRFKELVDEMDDLGEGAENVTATPEVRDLIGRVRDILIEDLELDRDSEEYLTIVPTLNELIESLRPEEERKELQEMRKEDAREEVGV